MQRKQKDVLPFGSVVSWQKKQTMKKEFPDWEMERVTRDSENKNSESLRRPAEFEVIYAETWQGKKISSVDHKEL